MLHEIYKKKEGKESNLCKNETNKKKRKEKRRKRAKNGGWILENLIPKWRRRDENWMRIGKNKNQKKNKEGICICQKKLAAIVWIGSSHLKKKSHLQIHADSLPLGFTQFL